MSSPNSKPSGRAASQQQLRVVLLLGDIGIGKNRPAIEWVASSDRNVETDGDPLEESAARDGALYPPLTRP
ncbi:MAG: hypothetical protein QOG46_1021, partial [Pseudonocardiales bacterium]|nr:hypothetical protein [Pseudonocardiales bacterium]